MLFFSLAIQSRSFLDYLPDTYFTPLNIYIFFVSKQSNFAFWTWQIILDICEPKNLCEYIAELSIFLNESDKENVHGRTYTVTCPRDSLFFWFFWFSVPLIHF